MGNVRNELTVDEVRSMQLRQSFRVTSGLVVILIVAWTTAAYSWPEQGVSQNPAVSLPSRPQDHDASALGRKIDEILRKELTEHWYPHSVDRKRGGFHQNIARDWSLQPDENVSLVYQARMTWTAAAFAQKQVWWTEAEGLDALLLMHHKYGDRTDRYEKAFGKQWSFIEKHLLDPVYGGWYSDTTRDGKLTGDGAKANAWKANYHTSRALMNVMRMLEKRPSS
jgi:mannose/cellobiose epimerase-like protein (N-acyl-D-glucosamine 2-epimerase family)